MTRNTRLTGGWSPKRTHGALIDEQSNTVPISSFASATLVVDDVASMTVNAMARMIFTRIGGGYCWRMPTQDVKSDLLLRDRHECKLLGFRFEFFVRLGCQSLNSIFLIQLRGTHSNESIQCKAYNSYPTMPSHRTESLFSTETITSTY